MSKTSSGGPAFPKPTVHYKREDGASVTEEGVPGMSLRAYFASLETLREWDNPDAVMSDAIAEKLCGVKRPEGNWSSDPVSMTKWEARWRAALKVIRADALISELEKETP